MKRVSSAEDRHAGRPGAHASKHSARLDTDSLLLKHVLSHELDTPAGAAVHVASGHADVATFTSIVNAASAVTFFPVALGAALAEHATSSTDRPREAAGGNVLRPLRGKEGRH